LQDAVALADAGAVVQIEGALGHLGYLTEFEQLYLDGIAELAPPDAVEHLRRHGLQRMHDVLSPGDIAALLPVLDRRAKRFAVPVSRAMVDLTSPDRPRYFICSRTWIRAQVPYRLVADDAEIQAHRHLTGHLVPTTPHRDVDLTHPRGTLSLWAAIGPVGAGNTIELFDIERAPDEASDHHTDAVNLRPTLAPGDVLIFNADRLHTSVPNTTNDTRVSVGTRIVMGRTLHYGPGTHWRAFYDARLVGTRLEAFATLQSRCTAAAVRRWQWQRSWNRDQRRRRRQQAAERPT
jgi:hypothetical protein